MDTPAIIVGFIFLTFFLIIRTLSNNRLKRIAIERGISGDELATIMNSVGQSPGSSTGPIRFGIVAITIGAVIILNDMFYFSEDLSWALFFIVIGVMLILTPKIEQKLIARSSEETA